MIEVKTMIDIVCVNIFACVFMGSVVLFICRCSLLLYAAWSDLNSVQVVLSGLSMRLLYCMCNCCMLWLRFC